MIKKQMKSVGFIGWRGMVGSVLLERMHQNNDFASFNPVFFSTSQKDQQVDVLGVGTQRLQDAYAMDSLMQMEIIVTCQGSDYTAEILPKLRANGWQGYWIDAASHLRMDEDSVIVLDPINRDVIDHALASGVKNFVGGNCTVSLMMLAIQGLLQEDLINWISVMSYQAVSGAGAKAMIELVKQTSLANNVDMTDSLKLERNIHTKVTASNFPCTEFLTPMAYNILPFIDAPLANGQSKEEWKAQAEMNKILQRSPTLPIDGICVRVPVLRAHSQALTIELKQMIDLKEVEQKIKSANEWVRFVDNDPQQTAKHLTPMAVSNTLDIAVGRLKKTNLSDRHIQLFTVGDQLLWGAAEPLRRMLNICLTQI
ncbi:aspartate-semialdehyde dehydrogenase [Cysteiniphilum litorale]|uniref:Aspartate-semialdehyde dehydrogenase n=2 Tax=Fastidiosibacteraceae TaxID=2056687 RepID=A0A8J3E9Q4_9GAMM|nr:aspartate-semialdehyde dehydrogenase [Cysteiniphilum litorale]